MDQIIEQMLQQQNNQTPTDKKNRIKEVMQEIVLCGLSRGGFFQNIAFYGGTALRIFHGLDRFSEDLDFSLKTPDPSFDIQEYIPSLEKEIRSYGVNFKIETKEKTADSNIKSAFLKGNTKEHLMMFFPNDALANTVGSGELIKIKFEVDINPPDYATYETKYRLIPIPCEVTLYDMPSLFAGKIHAVICRSWKSRVKGRDLYDYIFYLSKGTPVNLKHLVTRLAQSGYIPLEKEITLEDIKEMLRNRFRSIDYAQAKQDVEPFIKNPRVLDLWSADFFCGITDSLQEK